MRSRLKQMKTLIIESHRSQDVTEKLKSGLIIPVFKIPMFNVQILFQCSKYQWSTDKNANCSICMRHNSASLTQPCYRRYIYTNGKSRKRMVKRAML